MSSKDDIEFNDWCFESLESDENLRVAVFYEYSRQFCRKFPEHSKIPELEGCPPEMSIAGRAFCASSSFDRGTNLREMWILKESFNGFSDSPWKSISISDLPSRFCEYASNDCEWVSEDFMRTTSDFIKQVERTMVRLANRDLILTRSEKGILLINERPAHDFFLGSKQVVVHLSPQMTTKELKNQFEKSLKKWRIQTSNPQPQPRKRGKGKYYGKLKQLGAWRLLEHFNGSSLLAYEYMVKNAPKHYRYTTEKALLTGVKGAKENLKKYFGFKAE